MTGMVTCVGLDVRARSTHGAAIDVETGELMRGSQRTCCRSPTAPNGACTATITECVPAASRTTSPSWPAHASSYASSGPPPSGRPACAATVLASASVLGWGALR